MNFRKILTISVVVLLASAAIAKAKTTTKSSTKITYNTVKIEGLDIFYREAGDKNKPTILLLHGFPTSSFMFRNLIPLLADKFHLVAPDYPGFGQSSMPKTTEFTYSFEHLTDIIDKFTEQLNLKTYSLYVQDYGSPIGFRLAVKHPERVRSLIIQNGNAYEFGLSENAEFLKTYGEKRNSETTEKILNFLKLEGTKFQYVFGAHNPNLISPDTWIYDQHLLDREGNSNIQIALFADYSSNVKSYPLWHEYFRKNQPPTLVVWGKNDPFFTVKGVEEGYKKDLKNIEINYFDGGHFALEEYTDEIAGKIRNFFDKQKIR